MKAENNQRVTIAVLGERLDNLIERVDTTSTEWKTWFERYDITLRKLTDEVNHRNEQTEKRLLKLELDAQEVARLAVTAAQRIAARNLVIMGGIFTVLTMVVQVGAKFLS